MASTPIYALPAAPLGASGITSLTSLQLKAKDPATQRQNLAKICIEAEGAFLTQLLGQMRQTFINGVDSRQKRTDYAHLYEQQVGQALANGGGLGLSRHLFAALKDRIPANLKEKQNNASRSDSTSGNPAPTGDFPLPGTPGMSGAGSQSPGVSPGGDHPEPGHGEGKHT